MTPRSAVPSEYDRAIVVGTALALYWSLYVQPYTGEVLALALGTVPLAAGLYRYVDSDRYLVELLVGLLAVVLGGMAPASVLIGSRVGEWLVGRSPLPLALGAALLVVLGAVLLRRVVDGVVTPDGGPADGSDRGTA
ncbi:hypothetical protein [Halostella litorea]|uniref:hypothetical protein n=1 Tax=Halostella litorea TaxID=2528831 RepID=UPI001091D177|nr:hypothetical protein [Halostella litorea]